MLSKQTMTRIEVGIKETNKIKFNIKTRPPGLFLLYLPKLKHYEKIIDFYRFTSGSDLYCFL